MDRRKKKTPPVGKMLPLSETKSNVVTITPADKAKEAKKAAKEQKKLETTLPPWEYPQASTITHMMPGLLPLDKVPVQVLAPEPTEEEKKKSKSSSGHWDDDLWDAYAYGGGFSF